MSVTTPAAAVTAAFAAAATAFSLVARSQGRRSIHATRCAAAATEAATKQKPEWTEIAWAVLVALLDIFKPLPVEATGPDAPGLKEIGAPTMAAALSGCELLNIRSAEALDAGKLVAGSGDGRTVVLFLTHWGDFNSWEVVQNARTAVRAGRLGGASVALVGIGSVEAGRKFVDMLELPEDIAVYADARASCHGALCFSRGALPQYADSLNPYLRVFLMLLGVGSPGTIRTVLGGYFGDRSLPAEATQWIDESLRQGAARGRFPTSVPQLPGDGKMLDLAEVGRGVWDEGFGTEGLRPFELATVRLQNMVGGIMANWGDLAPADDELLVQQGGAVVVGPGGETQYYFRDKGILTYVPFEDLLKKVGS